MTDNPEYSRFRLSITNEISEDMTRPDSVLARYPQNATYPADPSLVAREQLIISRSVYRDVVKSIPDSFTSSMGNMVLLAQMSTDSKLSAENQTSFHKAKERALPAKDLRTVLLRDKYAKGLAVGEEVLELMLTDDIDTVGLITRTHAFQDQPQDLKDDMSALYKKIIELQSLSDGDIIGKSNERVKVKMLDRKAGQGGLEALLISKKVDFATVGGGKYVITERDRCIVDVVSMPMRWRSKLRKLVSGWPLTVEDDEEEAISRQLLFEAILDLPNPENPDQTLRTLNEEADYIYPFSTNIYATKTELSSKFDDADDSD